MEWISVKDRLPDVQENVLVFVAFKEPTKKIDGKMRYRVWDTGIDTGARFIKGTGPSRWALGDRAASEYDRNCIEVTHWMPLPKPPNA